MKVDDLVFVKQDGNKHTTREKCLVTALDQDHLWARKLTGSQFHAKTYELKYCDVYLVPTSQVPLCPIKSSDPHASDALSDNVSISDLNGYPDIRVPELCTSTRIRNHIPEYPHLSLSASNIAHGGRPSPDMSQLHKVTSKGNCSVNLYNNIVFSPFYTIYSVIYLLFWLFKHC